MLGGLAFWKNCEIYQMSVGLKDGNGYTPPGFVALMSKNESSGLSLFVNKTAEYSPEPYKLNITASLNDTKKSNLTDFQILLYVLPKPNDYAPEFA